MTGPKWMLAGHFPSLASCAKRTSGVRVIKSALDDAICRGWPAPLAALDTPCHGNLGIIPAHWHWRKRRRCRREHPATGQRISTKNKNLRAGRGKLPSFVFIAAVVCAALVAWLAARGLARGSHVRPQALDDTCGGLRKIHAAPTPRIGGIAVALGIAAGAAVWWYATGRLTLWLVLVCVAPAFIWGLIEDLSKRGVVLPRLALPALAGALGFVLLDARLTQLALPGIDDVLTIHALAFLITVFAVTGVTHAINVVDGLNGLAGATTFLAALGLAIVARTVGDDFIFVAASVVAAGVGGFLLVNYPSGRIFLGDGGAYLVGLLLAELSVLLVQRNSEVSPWFPLLLLAYPIWETLFSMYRRKTRGYSTAHADGLHLHQLVYRRLVRWHSFGGRTSDKVMRNSVASLLMWALPLACFFAAVTSWHNTLLLQAMAIGFVLAYCGLYRVFVRFRVPKWAVMRARERSAPESIAEAARTGR